MLDDFSCDVCESLVDGAGLLVPEQARVLFDQGMADLNKHDISFQPSAALYLNLSQPGTSNELWYFFLFSTKQTKSNKKELNTGQKEKKKTKSVGLVEIRKLSMQFFPTYEDFMKMST